MDALPDRRPAKRQCGGWLLSFRLIMLAGLRLWKECVTSELGPLPPHVQLFDFLPEGEHRRLLEWVLGEVDAFTPASVTIGDKWKVDPVQRIALTAYANGEIEADLKARLSEALPEIVRLTGYHGPAPTSLELEIAAHGDGAHYKPHLDIPVGQKRAPLGALDGEDRALSAVYYFHAQPKLFSGGELRLYRFGTSWDCADADPSHYVDLQPIDNSLVVFPSWAMHEVRPVRCPSGDFKDYRFALNCWYCRPTVAADQPRSASVSSADSASERA